MLCCADSSKMTTGACRILQKQFNFGESDMGAIKFSESPSNIGRNAILISVIMECYLLKNKNFCDYGVFVPYLHLGRVS